MSIPRGTDDALQIQGLPQRRVDFPPFVFVAQEFGREIESFSLKGLMLQKSNPIWRGVTLGALATSLLPANAFDLESVDKWMSYNIGELRIRPQFALSTEFTDNVYFAGLQARHFVFPAVPILLASPSGGYVYSGYYVGKDVPTGAAVNGIYYNSAGQRFNAGEPYTGAVVPQNPSAGVSYYLPKSLPGGDFYAEGGTTKVSPRNSELITSATPGVKFQYGDEVLNFFSLSYGVQLSKYLISGIEPDPQHNIRFRGKLEYSRLTLDLNSSAQMTSSYLGAGQNFFAQNTLINRWSEDTTARLTYQLSSRISTYAEFGHSLVDYISDVSLYGTATWQGNLGASYNISDEWSVFGEGHYGQSTISPSSKNLPDGPHSEVYGAFLGTRGTFTPRFSGSAKFGYELRGYPSIGLDPVGAPAFDIDVTYAAGPATQLNLAYSRKTSPSSQISAQTFVFDYVTLSATQGFGAAGYWWATVSTRYVRGDYSSRSQTGNVFEPIPGTSLYSVRTGTLDYGHTDDQVILSATMRYTPRPWMWISLTYEYEMYTPNFIDSRLVGSYLPEYDNHRVTLSLNLGY